MGCGAAEATGLGFVLLFLILMFCQPTELILGFLFYKFSNLPPPPRFYTVFGGELGGGEILNDLNVLDLGWRVLLM